MVSRKRRGSFELPPTASTADSGWTYRSDEKPAEAPAPHPATVAVSGRAAASMSAVAAVAHALVWPFEVALVAALLPFHRVKPR